MKRGIILIAVVLCVIVGLVACAKPPPPPQTIDAPKLAASLKWLGTCAVLCSALGATALVIASRNRRK